VDVKDEEHRFPKIKKKHVICKTTCVCKTNKLNLSFPVINGYSPELPLKAGWVGGDAAKKKLSKMLPPMYVNDSNIFHSSCPPPYHLSVSPQPLPPVPSLGQMGLFEAKLCARLMKMEGV
jgi:hypothetical protein